MIETYGVWLNNNIIRRILKERLNYSFKRWSPRPLLIDNSILKIKKVLFAVKLLKMINKSTVIINVDEATISKSTKMNYSWGPKGTSLNLSTIAISGSISLVTAIASNGLSITGIKDGTIRSSSFVEYIWHWLSIWERL